MSQTASTDQSFQLRKLEASTTDQEIVWLMLMHAAHEDEVNKVKTFAPLQPYAQNFGQEKGDFGLVALDGDLAIGAAWVRELGVNGFASFHLKDNDNFDELKAMPELAIACLPENRRKGVGYSLLTSLLQSAKDKNHPGVCLSCRESNPAMRLYERVGFVKVPRTEYTNRAGGISITMQYLF